MIIECTACHARFRLDEGKIKGRGARVRCRRCGESILVLKATEPAAEAPPERPAPKTLDLRSIVQESLGGGQAPPVPPAEPEKPSAAPLPVPSAAPPDAPPADGTPTAWKGPGTLDLRAVIRESLSGPQAPPAPAEDAGEPPAPPPVPSATPPVPVTAREGKDEVDAAFEEFLAGGSGLPVSAEDAPPQETETEAPVVAEETAVEFQAEEKMEIPEPPPSDFLLTSHDTLGYLSAEAAKGMPQPEFDISTSVLTEPASREPDVPESPPEAPPAPPSDFPVGEERPAPPAASAEPAPLPPPTPIRKEAPAAAESAKPMLPESRKTSPLIRPSLAALILLFLALAGGGAYLGFTERGQETLRRMVPEIESLWLQGRGKPITQYDVRNLIGYYERETTAGNLFVIKGQVTNVGRTRKTGTRIRAALLDSGDNPLAEKTCYAGNVLPGEVLRTSSRERIDGELSNRFGAGLVNMDVPPGKTVPFMVVFFDAPDGIGAYRIEAREGE